MMQKMKFLPEWSREWSKTTIPIKDKDGNYYYTDFSHGFAYDTVYMLFN